MLEYSAEYRPVGQNIELYILGLNKLYIRLLNIELNIGLEGRIYRFKFSWLI